MQDDSIKKVVAGLLARGRAHEDSTSVFVKLKHDKLVQQFIDYLDSHRHFLGICHIEQCHALNDRGVDLILLKNGYKIGFQLKSHHDVAEKMFAANVKRQLAESHAHGLNQYIVLICCPLRSKATNYTMKISSLLNELSSLQTNGYHEAYGPVNTAQYFLGLPPMPRDALLKLGAIDESALHDYERGYEHLPEIDDKKLRAATKMRARYEDELWESEEGRHADKAFWELLYRLQAEHFNKRFLPTLPPRIQERRSRLNAKIQELLQKCRTCKSWDDRSEYKLPSWIEYVPEKLLTCTSLPNLLRIKDSLTQYLAIHKETDRRLITEKKDSKYELGPENSETGP